VTVTTIADNATEGTTPETVIMTLGTLPTGTTAATGQGGPITTSINDTSVVVVGNTYALTTAIDVLPAAGTTTNTGDDTFVGDNTGTTDTMTGGDQLVGNTGNDTLKAYLKTATDLSTVTWPAMSSIENLYITGSLLKKGTTANFSTLTGVTNVVIDTPAAMVNTDSFTIQTGTGQKVGLTKVNGSTTASDNSTVKLNGTSDLTVNAVGTTDSMLTVDVTGATTAALTLTSTGTTAASAASKLTLTNTGGALASLTLAGAGDTTLTTGALTAINASTSTGANTVDVGPATLPATFAYTGGSGIDKLKLGTGDLGTITAGSQLNGGGGTADVLVTNETALLTEAQLAKLNATTGFEVLGFGTTGSGVDISKLTGFSKFQVEAGNLSESFSNATTANTFYVDNTSANTGKLTIANKTGESTTTVVVDNQAGAAKTLVGLTVGGINTVNLASTGKAGGSNTITALANADNSNVIVTGALDLTITNALVGTSIGSKVDAGAFTGKLSVTGSGLSDVLIGGSAVDTLNGGAVTHTVAATAETAIVDFASTTTHVQNKTVTLGGLTLTVDAAAGLAGDVIASAFASLANGAIGTNNAGNYTFTGALSGYSTGALHHEDQVTFTSTTTGGVADLANTGNAALTSVTVTQGVNAVTGSVDTLTGNASADIFAFSTADVDTAVGAVTAIITDFVSGTDKIIVTEGANAGAGSTTNYVEATATAADLATLLTAANTALDGTVDYYVGQVGTDSYLVTDAGDTGYTNVIKLAGVALTGIAYTDLIA
jgi:S-layer protein